MPSLTTTTKPDERRFKTLDLAMKRNHYRQDALIEVLHQAQATFGYLEDDVLIYIARGLKLPLSRVYGVATFYHLFSLKPAGEHTCVVCLGTTCYVKGANALLAAIDNQIGIHPGETTTDGKISLLTARCVGACGIAPVVVLDGKVSGRQTVADVSARIEEWGSK